MRIVLQRVTQASVDVAGERVASIGRGLLVLVGVEPDDDVAVAEHLAQRTAGLRIFPKPEQPQKHSDLSVVDVQGEVLVVSQFTLAADTSRGRRPSFTTAAEPTLADQIYQAYALALEPLVQRVATGQFGADMQVALVNDGPVTYVLERAGS